MPRGGKRDGAGRKRSPAKYLRKATAAAILAAVDEQKLWKDLLDAKVEPRIRLDALKYLTDRRDGKPAQAISFPEGGDAVPVRIISSVPRPERNA